jgi:nucleotide-binding universal stress UspA family protein
MILAPIDRSSRDSFVLGQCARLGKALDIPVFLLHVLAPTKAFFPHAARDASAYLEAMTGSFADQGVVARSEVRRGDPTTVIVEVAAEIEAQFIVMATRARRGLDKFALGSVTDAVVAYSRAPVIIVKEGDLAATREEKTRSQAAYLATVVWDKQARGMMSEADAEHQLEQLVLRGLDRDVLFGTYRALGAEGGRGIDWLDIDFQRQAIEDYLTDGATNTSSRGAA